MKKILLLTGLCALTLSTLAACKDDQPGEPETLATPSGLASADVTTTSAALSWTAVPNAESYLVKINDGTPVVAATTTYAATGLTSETAYKWAVQAVKGTISSAWSAEATFTTATEAIPTPGGLLAAGITHSSAQLSWVKVDGATGYEVKVGDKTPATVSQTTYTAEGLDYGTEYTWTVTALKGERRGEAATSKFTTSGPSESIVYTNGTCYGDYFNNGTGDFILVLSEFDPAILEEEEPDLSKVNGRFTSFELLSVDTQATVDKQYVDLPEGTYTIVPGDGYNNVAGDILADAWDSISYEFLNGMILGEEDELLESGTMTVEKEGNVYTLIVDFTFTSGENWFAKYVGELLLANTNYVMPSEPVDFGVATILERMEYYPNAYDFWGEANPDLDVWIADAWTEGLSPDPETGYLMGKGWLITTMFHMPIYSGTPMPDGEYSVDGGYTANTAASGKLFMGELMEGTAALYIEDGWALKVQAATGGTITSSWRDNGSEFGEYTIVFNATDPYGSAITGTIKANAPNPDSVVEPEPEYAAVKGVRGVKSAKDLKGVRGVKGVRDVRGGVKSPRMDYRSWFMARQK